MLEERYKMMLVTRLQVRPLSESELYCVEGGV